MKMCKSVQLHVEKYNGPARKWTCRVQDTDNKTELSVYIY